MISEGPRQFNGRGQLRRGGILNFTKTSFEPSTHVALCGFEHRQQQTRVVIGPPGQYVHGHTLRIMLARITGALAYRYVPIPPILTDFCRSSDQKSRKQLKATWKTAQRPWSRPGFESAISSSALGPDGNVAVAYRVSSFPLHTMSADTSILAIAIVLDTSLPGRHPSAGASSRKIGRNRRTPS